MAKIKVNDKYKIEGGISLINECSTDTNPQVINHSGILSTNKYIEDIDKLETDKFVLYGVNVYYESLGSDDDQIIYRFTLRDIEIKKDLILE